MLFIIALALIPFLSFGFNSKDVLNYINEAKTWTAKSPIVSPSFSPMKKSVAFNNFYTLDEDGQAIEAYITGKDEGADVDLKQLPKNLECGIRKFKDASPVEAKPSVCKELKACSIYSFIDSQKIRTIGVAFESEDKKNRFDADILKKGEKIAGTAIIQSFEQYFYSKDDRKVSRAREKLNNAINAKNHHILFIESALLIDENSKKKNKLYKIPKTNFDGLVLFYQSKAQKNH